MNQAINVSSNHPRCPSEILWNSSNTIHSSSFNISGCFLTNKSSFSGVKIKIAGCSILLSSSYSNSLITFMPTFLNLLINEFSISFVSAMVGTIYIATPFLSDKNLYKISSDTSVFPALVGKDKKNISSVSFICSMAPNKNFWDCHNSNTFRISFCVNTLM